MAAGKFESLQTGHIAVQFLQPPNQRSTQHADGLEGAYLFGKPSWRKVLVDIDGSRELGRYDYDLDTSSIDTNSLGMLRAVLAMMH